MSRFSGFVFSIDSWRPFARSEITERLPEQYKNVLWKQSRNQVHVFFASVVTIANASGNISSSGSSVVAIRRTPPSSEYIWPPSRNRIGREYLKALTHA